jgi:hypothetical protein
LFEIYCFGFVGIYLFIQRIIQQIRIIMADKPQLTLIHFNDAYHIEPRDKEPVAGGAR